MPDPQERRKAVEAIYQALDPLPPKPFWSHPLVRLRWKKRSAVRAIAIEHTTSVGSDPEQ